MIEDRLALVTGMAIITVDYRGFPVTRHSECTEFCKKIRLDPKTNGICKNVMPGEELKQ